MPFGSFVLALVCEDDDEDEPVAGTMETLAAICNDKTRIMTDSERFMAEEILNYWFPGPMTDETDDEGNKFDRHSEYVKECAKRHWKPDENVKQHISENFSIVISDDLDCWLDDRAGRLAYIIIRHNFPRILFKGTAKEFATD